MMQQRIILASASPRRRELLELLRVRNLEIVPADVDETMPSGVPPEELVKALSCKKAGVVAEAEQDPDAVIIGADTVVALDGTVLGKPRDAADAARMLRLLSGRRHAVYTGVTALRGAAALSRAERTEVVFRPLSDGEIERYTATGEPLDKAGAYGIQGLGSLLVERIDGDFFNVMGLPLCLLGQMLKELGVTLL